MYSLTWVPPYALVVHRWGERGPILPSQKYILKHVQMMIAYMHWPDAHDSSSSLHLGSSVLKGVENRNHLTRWPHVKKHVTRWQELIIETHTKGTHEINLVHVCVSASANYSTRGHGSGVPACRHCAQTNIRLGFRTYTSRSEVVVDSGAGYGERGGCIDGGGKCMCPPHTRVMSHINML